MNLTAEQIKEKPVWNVSYVVGEYPEVQSDSKHHGQSPETEGSDGAFKGSTLESASVCYFETELTSSPLCGTERPSRRTWGVKELIRLISDYLLKVRLCD